MTSLVRPCTNKVISPSTEKLGLAERYSCACNERHRNLLPPAAWDALHLCGGLEMESLQYLNRPNIPKKEAASLPPHPFCGFHTTTKYSRYDCCTFLLLASVSPAALLLGLLSFFCFALCAVFLSPCFTSPAAHLSLTKVVQGGSPGDCPKRWAGGSSKTHEGSCWCGWDGYCMCTPSLAIDTVVEVSNPGTGEVGRAWK